MDAQAGYDPDRFISTVPRRLLCGICYQVLKEPRLCKDGDHCFCLSCISKHLNELSHTCPVCTKDLTPETLVQPQRYLKENLGELQIKCDYIERGCPDHIQLGNLQDHVNNCGFAPVTCEQCEMQINRKDKDNHEKSFCQLGAAKCQDCGNIKAGQDEIKLNQDEMKENQHLMNIQLTEILIDERGAQMRENFDRIEESQDELKRQMAGIKRKQDEIDSNVNEIKDEMKGEMVVVKRRQDEIDDKVNKIMDSVDEIKKAQVEMRNETIQQFENFTKMLTQVEYRAFLSFSSTNEIMVMGGANEESDGRRVIVNSASILDFSDGTWNELPPMNQCRLYAASFVYNNDIFVTGGADGQDSLDSIEILKKKQHPSRWTIFGGKLPVGLCHHDVVVYQNQLYTIGGCIDEQGATNAIYKLALTPPYAADILTTMPQPRMTHRAEIVNDKLYVLGGGTTGNDATDSVVVYDFAANTFDTCEPLLKPVHCMSTVTWGNKIIVIGGRGEELNALNDVVMYDTETERSETLPSLNHRRHGHSAVIMNDVIVVLGGKNRQGYLKSVERFTIGSDRWIELPGMKEKKHSATAVVKPCN